MREKDAQEIVTVPPGVVMHFLARVELENVMQAVAEKLGRPVMVCLRPVNGAKTFLRTSMSGGREKNLRGEEGLAFYAMSKTTAEADSTHFADAKRGNMSSKKKSYNSITHSVQTVGRDIRLGGLDCEVFVSTAALERYELVDGSSLKECLAEIVDALEDMFGEFV
ncbi:hypothetical protein FWH09_00495 [Candidatus Saccharibacteria bacterium]|nr:hypothetical protein [Candidatus Saccharibacteria bacterium]